jgi:hypothetical protein
MTISASPQGLPVAVSLAASLTKDDLNEEKTGPKVGASDAAASGADVDLDGATRDSDGVPVGSADAGEDRRASGA